MVGQGGIISTQLLANYWPFLALLCLLIAILFKECEQNREEIGEDMNSLDFIH